ncbi:MAG: hypothetical protein QOF89_5670 [Acidobacteriota bacterium]|jgi:hypothetical protein|nr:hypothetical protein [Acidobacteriota bacterium]
MRFRSLALGLALLALLCGCYNKSDFSPTEPLASSVITLSSPSGVTSLPADGFSRLHLEARLPGDPAFANRTVVFSTTGGTLAGGTPGTNCNGCVTVAADGSGIARIDLISAPQVGSATVTASPSGAPGILASLTVSFVAANPDDTLRFVAAPDRAPADGATLTTFTVAISPSLPAASRQVTFAATAGTIVPPNPVNVDAGGHASVDLQSPRTITSGRVTATVNGVTREVPIRFERALPKIITVNANPAVAPAASGTTIQITATLIRDQGIVTDGTVVTFRAARADGTPVGGFTNITTTTNGMASATFLPRTTTPGTVIITVGAQDTAVTGTVQVDLTGS